VPDCDLSATWYSRHLLLEKPVAANGPLLLCSNAVKTMHKDLVINRYHQNLTAKHQSKQNPRNIPFCIYKKNLVKFCKNSKKKKKISKKELVHTVIYIIM